MSTAGDRLAVDCPSCSSAESTVHEVLKAGSGRHTVRCTECAHVHKVRVESDARVERDVVVSQDDESFSTRTEIPPSETLSVGDEFIVDSAEAILQVRITGLELGPEERAETARAEDVATIWTRGIDNVTVKTTLNPKEGTGDRESSRSFDLQVPGDYEFVVGETESLGDEEFRVKAVQVRDDAPEYRHGKLDHEGDMVYARDVKRLYGTDRTTSAWSAW
jgi:uncharacterized Zn finger protein